MFRTVAQQLQPLLDRPRLDVVVLSLFAAMGGVAEAAVLVLVVNAAVSIADGTSDLPVELPVIGWEASIGQVLWLAAALAIASAVMNVVVAWLSARLSAGVLQTARRRLMRAYLGAGWEQQSIEQEGSVQESATTLAFNSSWMTTSLIHGLAALIALAGMLATAFVVDPVVTGVVLAFGLVLFVLFRPVVRRTERLSSRYVDINSTYTEEVARIAGMSMEFRVFGVGSSAFEQLESWNERVGGRLRQLRFAARAGVTFYRDAAILFLVAAVAALSATDGDRLVEIGAVALLVVRSLGYSTQVQWTVQAVGELSPNLAELTRRLERLEAHQEPTGTVTVHDFDTITLHSVSYRYPDRGPAVQDVDLTIERGEVLGVVGPSGSGKSTLVQLLLRLRRPDGGRVLVDGHDADDIDGSWSSLVSLVPQEPQLTAATIAENIAFLRPGVDRAAIERAADAAHVGDEIRALPDGFDTMLGPRGAGLSGGQKQRVAVARALVGSPRLLVLDEPTSALDSVSEERIRSTIEELRGDVTVVIVAHRPTTLDVCDRIVTVADGRIAGIEPG